MNGSFGSLREPSDKTQGGRRAINSPSVAQHLSVSMSESVDDRDNLRVFCQSLLFLFRNKRPQLVDVDGGPPLCVAGQVESAHTHFTKVTRVVLVKVDTTHQVGPLFHKVKAERHTGGGAYHQRDHDLRGVYGASQHVRDRQRHDHGACESLRGGSAFLYKAKETSVSLR